LRWQKDGRAVRIEELSFTANVSWWCGSGRIAHLMPAPASDTWWELHGDDPTGPVTDAVVSVVRTYLVPAILAGLEEPERESDPRMHSLGAYSARSGPDDGGAEPTAWYVQPAGASYDWAFEYLTSAEPYHRLYGLSHLVGAPDDPRTVPALLHHLEYDPDPVVRESVAARVLTRFGQDPQVPAALRGLAAGDPVKGVRWAGRFALRVIAEGNSGPGLAS
jgi:hypothetical protein